MCSIYEHQEKAFDLNKNIKRHGLIFHYNIRSDNALGIGYFAVIWIPCMCSACLSKLYYPWNRRQDKYNQVRYKYENLQCV